MKRYCMNKWLKRVREGEDLRSLIYSSHLYREMRLQYLRTFILTVAWFIVKMEQKLQSDHIFIGGMFASIDHLVVKTKS